MKNFLSLATHFILNEAGASAVEYAILVAAIATVIVAITVIVGYQVQGLLKMVCDAVATATGKTCDLE